MKGRRPLNTAEFTVVVVVAVIVAAALGAFRSEAGASGWLVGIAAGVGVGLVTRYLRGSGLKLRRSADQASVGSMSRKQIVRALEWCLGVVLVAFAFDGTRSAVNGLALTAGLLVLLVLRS